MVVSDNFRFEIVCSLRRLQPLFESKILWETKDNLFRESVYIEVLIRLNDLLQKSRIIGKRMSFVDDIKVGGEISDITDLVRVFRDCVCHMDTKKRNHGEKSYAFIELRGKIQYEYDSTIECLYEDEINTIPLAQRAVLKHIVVIDLVWICLVPCFCIYNFCQKENAHREKKNFRKKTGSTNKVGSTQLSPTLPEWF